ncbi:MAG TPA: MBL fold metallo-hydrolase [Ktedonobacterales bacterium]|nr:MBL fold metallo-hydrolase [Ktedonobacterales bacterium]
MDISWLGHSCFRLRGKEATLVTDPPGPTTGYSLSRLTADIVTISHHHPGHDYVKGVGGDPMIVDGPGEYEIKQTLITGVQTYHDRERGRLLGRNTAYLIALDDVHVAHLGDLGDKLDNRAEEALNGCDVLLIPVGGGKSLNAEQAAEVIAQLEPSIIIPMHYATPAYKLAGEPLDPVERFCHEMGVTPPEPIARLSVTPTSLPTETQIIILNYRG